MVAVDFIFFFLNSLSFANSLSKEEEKYFNFLDLNNDNQISLDEMYRALRLVFQLIDENNDEIIDFLLDFYVEKFIFAQN